MKVDVILPNLGFGMEEGKLIGWLKQPGERIHKGEAIAEIEGDKANVELQAVVDGDLDEILVAPGSTIPVGSVLARIRPAEAANTPPQSTSPQAAPAPGQRITPVAQRVASAHGIDVSVIEGTGPRGRILRNDVQSLVAQKHVTSDKVLAAPAVRKLARDRGLDLRGINPTGSQGQITRADVESALNRQPADQALTPVVRPDESDKRREVAISPMRRAIARQLSRSAQEAPHFFVTAELDLTDALKKLPQEIGINTLLLYVAVQALHDVPALNATYEDGHLYAYKHVNLAVAVALDQGLITPVLQHADDYSLAGLAERSRELISRARSGKLRQEDLAGGTFTVSNLGMVQQVEQFTAIINPPQVAILAIGAAKDRPLVIDGGLHIRKTTRLTLSVDHRIVDGWGAARYLEAYDTRLQTFIG